MVRRLPDHYHVLLRVFRQVHEVRVDLSRHDELRCSILSLRYVVGVGEISSLVGKKLADWEESLQFLIDAKDIIFIGENVF